MNGFTEKWVNPFYMDILHGNFVTLKGTEHDRFLLDVLTARSSITEEIVSNLLSSANWRDQIVGSWFCGLKAWKQFREQIGANFQASKVCYAGQGYAFALACFADPVSVQYVTEYLEHYLKLPKCFYEQDWAMAALMWTDAQNDTACAEPYLVPNGAWDKFIADKPEWSLETSRDEFWRIMAYCRTHFAEP